MQTNDPLGQDGGKPLRPDFNAVQGAEEILALNSAFKNNWPAIRRRLADRASAMFACYAAIAEQARTNNRISEDTYAMGSKAIFIGREITAVCHGDGPPPQNDWEATCNALIEALSLTAEALGLAAGESAP